MPPRTVAHDAQVRDRDARRPVLRLHEQRAANCRIAKLLVGVAVDDEIDPRHLTRHPRADILARHARRHRVVARGLVESRVEKDDDDVSAGLARRRHGVADRRHDVTNHHVPSEIVAIPEIGARSRTAHQCDLHALPLDHLPRVERMVAVGRVGIRREHRKASLADHPA